MGGAWYSSRGGDFVTGTNFVPAIFAVDVVDADMHAIGLHISIP